jgi:hypothetical protein
MKFYEVYYSANQMSLAVVAPQSLSQLSKFVKEAFCAIPNRNVNPPEDRWAYRVPPYGKPGLIPSDRSVVEIVPIQELRQVTVTWPIIFKSKKEREAFRLNKVGRYVIFRTPFFISFLFRDAIATLSTLTCPLLAKSRTTSYRGSSVTRVPARCFPT